MFGEKILWKIRIKHSGGRVAYLICIDVDPNKKNKFSKKKAATEVLMNRGPGALDFTEEPEGENTYGKANQ